MSKHFHHISAGISLVLVLAITGGACGMWFGRPGAGWVGNRAVWERPKYRPDTVQVDESLADDRGRGQDVVMRPWSEEEEDKRNSQLPSSSRYIFNLIRGKGRVSTTKRSAECEPGEFRCTEDGSCIPQQLLCNNQPDCPAGTDEAQCKSPTGPAASAAGSVHKRASADHGPRAWDIGARSDARHDLMRFDECVEKLIYGLRVAGPFTRSSYDCPKGFSKCEAESRQCYDDRYACDGYQDCPNGSDEMGCESSPCPAEGFIKCRNNWQCFDRTRTCDGIVDCRDGSDERACETKACVDADQVKCGDGKQCFKAEYTCDGIIDCTDGSDEHNCSLFQCRHGFTKCANGHQCYKTSFQCDGIAHCVDSSDEINCPSQGKHHAVSNASQSISVPEWQCNTHESCADGNKCYLQGLRCDGVPACDDGSDEWQCASTSCPLNKVKCQDRVQCIWEAWLCDGEVDCKDGSEEQGCSSYVPEFEPEVGKGEAGKNPDSAIATTTRGPTVDPACLTSTVRHGHQSHASTNHTGSTKVTGGDELTGKYRM